MPGWEGATRKATLPAEWRRTIRPQVLARDPQCTLRTHCAGAPSTDVDHVGDRDDHSLTNLRGVCADCHGHRSGRQGAAARVARGRYVSPRRPVEPHPGLRH